MATRSDNFNRSNSTNLGSNWSEDSGDWYINSNTVYNGTVSNYRKLRWIGAALDSNDYWVEGVFRSSSDALAIGPAARMTTNSTVTYYALLFFPGDNAYLVYINAGAENILASTSGVSFASNTNYTLRIEVEGTTIRGYVNGTQLLSATHSALTSGSPGIAAYGGGYTGTWGDDWSAGDLGPASDALTATNLIAGAPVLGATALNQIHALAATALATSTPVLSTASIAQIHALAASVLTTGSPIVGNATLSQIHTLAANEIAAGAPLLGAPSIGGEIALTATAIVAGAPLLDAATLSQIHTLAANEIAAGAPLLGAPSISGEIALTATAITTGAPVLDAVVINQIHILLAVILVAGNPRIGVAALNEAPAPASRILAIAAERREVLVAAERRGVIVAAERRIYTAGG